MQTHVRARVCVPVRVGACPCAHKSLSNWPPPGALLSPLQGRAFIPQLLTISVWMVQ